MTEPLDAANAGNTAKRAVHVKWQGKTIALGTFPSTEADEKCAKAKALTRAWRSGMRPKPTRDWVITELERLGIRVVSGGRANRKGEEEVVVAPATSMAPGLPVLHPGMMPMSMNAMAKPQMNGQMGTQQISMMQNQQDAQSNLKQARRSSSLGLALLSNEFGKSNAFNSTQPSISNSATIDLIGKPAFRELVGGGAAAAYNAYRDDFYRQQPEQGNESGGNSDGNGIGNKIMRLNDNSNITTAMNPNDHYQMLKLHHMNLLNEIQETTLMMNIYQQQHLQQQQLLIQQQQNMASINNGDSSQMSMMLSSQQNGGGLQNLQQIQQNVVNHGQTHSNPSELQRKDSASHQRQTENSQINRDKRQIEEDSTENDAKRQKTEGNGVVTYGV